VVVVVVVLVGAGVQVVGMENVDWQKDLHWNDRMMGVEVRVHRGNLPCRPSLNRRMLQWYGGCFSFVRSVLVVVQPFQ
jgi:hypothetical protein